MSLFRPTDVAAAAAPSGVSASSSAEFVVVDHVDDLRNQQKVLLDTVHGILRQLAKLDRKANLVADTARVLDYYWRTYCSLLLTICPVLLAFIIDYKTRDSYYPMDLPSSMVQILVGFTICVGLPTFAFHTFELFEMREGMTGGDEDEDEWKSTDDEDEEAGSGDEDAAASADEDGVDTAAAAAAAATATTGPAETAVPETIKSDDDGRVLQTL
ncbi:hypothetical protein NP493_35g06027 [Ridgeia piscesae]|uniref:Uncharacterized protein n=1 Tax=Ridgeia piscesae TaxID=27915 RepID=A0AAD9UK81_RIDPI|nr:hypothetical protein NP493_35g06027 [Ridgeia piscesae]